MKESKKIVSALIVMALLFMTSYTLLLPNNRPLFAQIRVSNHGGGSIIREQTSIQNFGYNSSNNNYNNYNRSRIQQQKNSFAHVFLRNMTTTKAAIATKTATDFNTTSQPRAMVNPNYDYGYNYSRSIKLNDTQPAATTSKTITITPENYVNVSKEIGNGVRIALVEPTFTAAAYNNSFYVFYARYNHVIANMNVTSDLNLLSSKVSMHPTIAPTTQVHSAFAMLSLLKNLKLISPDSNITVLTDADVDNGSIFNKVGTHVNSKSNAYDVIILGHQEYVTQQEYNYLRDFVADGGSMILLDGNVFYAQVILNHNTNTITFMKGHGWAFNGKSAWKSVSERWAKETSQWVGSNYLCYTCNISFANDPWEYQHHEEQYITNNNDKILMNYNASLIKYPIRTLRPIIATYELNYQKGKVISLGIYSDDIITNKKFVHYFDDLVLRYASHKE
jgi:hypothetical protein